MATDDFDAAGSATPTSIGSIRVTLIDPDGTNPNRRASAEATVLDADGNATGTIAADDIRPILTAGEKSGLAALLDKIRTRAEGKLPA